jgi:hypothetical protein
MNLKEAKEITGGLSSPSKMPGRAFSLPALVTCPMGSILRKEKHTTCSKCYALKGNYSRPNVQKAMNYRHHRVEWACRDRDFANKWVDAMALQIKAQSPWHFRWHDSGDVYSKQYLDLIVRVCMATPDTKHFLPTKEAALVRSNRTLLESVPNLTVRLSSGEIGTLGTPVSFHGSGLWAHVEKIDTDNATATLIMGKAGALLCQSKTRGHVCGSCRACWSKRVKHVVFQQH